MISRFARWAQKVHTFQYGETEAGARGLLMALVRKLLTLTKMVVTSWPLGHWAIALGCGGSYVISNGTNGPLEGTGNEMESEGVLPESVGRQIP